MNDTAQWYSTIIKPSFSPPAWAFGVAWSILYPIIFASFGYIYFQIIRKHIPGFVAIPVTLNLISNFAFSPIQFGLKNNVLAMVDIFIVLGSLIWALKLILPYSKTAFYALIPYLIWVSFATILQISITYLNLK
jgi:benzodiazapine receptor